MLHCPTPILRTVTPVHASSVLDWSRDDFWQKKSPQTGLPVEDFIVRVAIGFLACSDDDVVMEQLLRFFTIEYIVCQEKTSLSPPCHAFAVYDFTMTFMVMAWGTFFCTVGSTWLTPAFPFFTGGLGKSTNPCNNTKENHSDKDKPLPDTSIFQGGPP